MSDISKFYYSLPPITRAFVTFPSALLLLDSIQIVSAYHFIWYFYMVRKNYQIWRVFTGFFIPEILPVSRLSTLFEIYSFYDASRTLELGKFKGDTASYLYYFLIVCPVILASTWYTSAHALFSPLLISLLFTSSRMNPSLTVQMFFFKFKAAYLPYAYLVMSLLGGGSRQFLISFSGYLGGYIYVCLEERNFGPLAEIALGYLPSFLTAPARSKTSAPERTRISGIHNLASKGSTSYIPAPTWLRSFVNSALRILNNVTGAGRSGPGGRKPSGGIRLGSLSDIKGNNSRSSTGYSSKPASDAKLQSSGSWINSRFPGKGNRLGS